MPCQQMKSCWASENGRVCVKTNPSSRSPTPYMVSQEPAFLNTQTRLEKIRRYVEQAADSGERIDRVERELFAQLLELGAVYSINRFPRSAADVVDEICRKQRAEHRPTPQNKQLWAEMTRCLAGSSATGRERLFVELAIACKDRDPERQKTLVCLLDGERSLWQMAGEWLPRAVGVLDLFHVLERLWTAAPCFHAEGSPEAATSPKAPAGIWSRTGLKKPACAGRYRGPGDAPSSSRLPQRPLG